MRGHVRWMLAMAGLVVTASAYAQIDYDGPLMRHAEFYSHTFHQKFLNDLVDPLKGGGTKARSGAAPRAAGSAPTRSATLAPATAGTTAVPRKMASEAPAAARAEVERVFAQLLAEYPKFERQAGMPANDLGAAVALFVAGSWMAYRDRDVPDEQFPKLASHMRELIGSSTQFVRASPQERREVYEQMAILGLYLTLTRMALKRKPNAAIAANMRNAGKRYLEDFLKIDPDRILITSKGLEIR